MVRHSLNCEHCEDGTVWQSRYGGNDPDVWPRKEPCEHCDGGNVFVEDEHGLIEEGSIVTAKGDATWFREPDQAERHRRWRRQWSAKSDGLTGHGSTEREAVEDLIAAAEDRECERRSDAEDAYRCGEVLS